MDHEPDTGSGASAPRDPAPASPRNGPPHNIARRAVAGFTRFTHWLTGAEPDLLERSSRSSRTLHEAIAILMLVAALFAGRSMGTALAGVWDLGTVATFAVSALVTVMALAMEAAVLASVAPGANPFATLGVRVPIGLLLVSLQAVPALTTMLSHEIELSLHERAMTQQAAIKEKAAMLLDLPELKAQAKTLEERHAHALSRQASPPTDPAVNAAAAQLAKATITQSRAGAAVNAATKRLGAAKEAAARAQDPRRLAPLVARAEEAAAKARTHFSAATAAIDNAEADVAQAKAARDKALAEAVQQAHAAIEAHASRVGETEARYRNDAEKARSLAEAANRPNFATQVTQLMRLATHDWPVAVTVALTVFGFTLLDLLPTLLKMASRRAAYFQMLADAERLRIERSRQELEAQMEEHAQMTLFRHNQTAGVRRFVEQDEGAIDARLLHAERERDADLRAWGAHLDMIETTARRLAEVWERLEAQNARVGAEPLTGSIFREQLVHLLRELEARARSLVGDTAAAPQRARPAV